MTENTKYNGWTNYATWRITNYATWRVNLEILDDYVSSLVGDGPQWPDIETCAANLEETVEEVITNYGEITGGLILDYARAFVSDVDYREIAETIKVDNPELFESAEEESEA